MGKDPFHEHGEEALSPKLLVYGFLAALGGVVAMLIGLVGFTHSVTWAVPSDAMAWAKVIAIFVLSAVFITGLLYAIFQSCYDVGRQEVRTFEVPVAIDRGREIGRIEITEALSDGGIRSIEELCDGAVFGVSEITPYGGSDSLVVMQGRLQADQHGIAAAEWVVRMPSALSDDLRPGGRYVYNRHGEPQKFERIG